jgi:hypothetical protein
MEARAVNLSIVLIIIVVAFIPVPVSAQTFDTQTSISLTDVVSGASLVGTNFATDLQVSITNSGTLGVGVLGAEIWVSFDPDIASVYDADGDDSNGTQVEIKNGFFDGSLVVVANEVFYDTPAIPHPTECDTQACIHVAFSQVGGSGPVTDGSGTVATITWVGQEIGALAVGIPVVGTGVAPGSVLSDPDGEPIPINNVSVPDIVVTEVGTITGIVERQGASAGYEGVEISALAADGGVVTTATTAADGSFSLEVPLVDTYAVNASYPGYLKAHKNLIEVGSDDVDIGSTRLAGGDVNADNCINILDIVSIIGDFGMDGLDPSAPQDINDDGGVNILDLTIAAGNFSRCGPTAWIP